MFSVAESSEENDGKEEMSKRKRKREEERRRRRKQSMVNLTGSIGWTSLSNIETIHDKRPNAIVHTSED